MPEQLTKPTGIKRATLWHEDSLALVGNAILSSTDVSQRHNFYARQNAPAINDKFSNGFILDAGTYNFSVLGIVVSSGGQIDWSLDGVTIATNQEWYAAVQAYNTLITVSGVVVPTSGWHVLTGLIDSKNVLSTDYTALLTKMVFVPSAD